MFINECKSEILFSFFFKFCGSISYHHKTGENAETAFSIFQQSYFLGQKGCV